MKTYKVSYETRMLEDREGSEVVAAPGKGRAMLAAQAVIHPDQRDDEPYHHFEPLSIIPLGGDSYEVRYKTKIERQVAGEVTVSAEDPDKAFAKARFAVHQEFIPPKCFKAVAVEEIGGA